MIPVAGIVCPCSISDLPESDLASKIVEALELTRQSGADVLQDSLQITSIASPDGVDGDLRLVVLTSQNKLDRIGESENASRLIPSNATSMSARASYQIGRQKTPLVLTWTRHYHATVTSHIKPAK